VRHLARATARRRPAGGSGRLASRRRVRGRRPGRGPRPPGSGRAALRHPARHDIHACPALAPEPPPDHLPRRLRVAGLLSVLQLVTRSETSARLDDGRPDPALLLGPLGLGTGDRRGHGVRRCGRGAGHVCRRRNAAGPSSAGALFLLLFVASRGGVPLSRRPLAAPEREIRNEERLALARELHDTVAHHVSAIAVQAQAGGVVAGPSPHQAVEVLAAIEAEASRTLAEMRSMVRVLRDDEAGSAYSPQPGVADLPGAGPRRRDPHVEVSLTGADRAAPPVDAAVYRLAQEALTNAVRHARARPTSRSTYAGWATTSGCASPTTGSPSPGRGTSPVSGCRHGRARPAPRRIAVGRPGPEGGWVVEAVSPWRSG
jgi:hypothetical protein